MNLATAELAIRLTAYFSLTAGTLALLISLTLAIRQLLNRRLDRTLRDLPKF